MGIPSYFSNIIKQYPTIIKKLSKNDKLIHNFFLDSNSIVYDCVRSTDGENNSDTTYQRIIKSVIKKIEEYINIVNPKNLIMISLDGTPPVAKMDQQRQRRYKSVYTSNVSKSFPQSSENITNYLDFNTVEITTGTLFMDELNTGLINHFNNPEKYGVNNIIVSTSDIPGEGESKIYEYIRNNNNNNSTNTSLIYGLDADLIMLSINHLPISPNIYLFRETPEFIKSIDSSLEPNENYMLDIPELSNNIMSYMNNHAKNSSVNRIYDYIFICFFLGNDFMPHFPAINIRTGGIDKMLNAYKATIGSTNQVITDGEIIYWRHLRKLVAFLAEKEHEYIITEMKIRDKYEHFNYPTETYDQCFTKFNATPGYQRELEKYINPNKSHWQDRYYNVLCHIDIDNMRKKQICTNYLEGLEWTMKYYTTGCVDWRWCYKYNYPPLIKDLLEYIPYFDTTYITPKNKNPVSPMVQLGYVLPKIHLNLLPSKIKNALLTQHPEWYNEECEFLWAFCRYFWEAHAQLPEIEMSQLEDIIDH